MNLLKKLASSLIFLLAACAITIGGLVASIFPASDYILEKSQSITDNFYILGALMLLLLFSGFLQTLLMVRIIWGAGAMAPPTPKNNVEDDLDDADIRSLKVTSTKKAFVFIVVILANIFVFNYLGKGIIATDTRAARALTLLRSPDGQDRADAVTDSILLIGDKRVARALKLILDTPGKSREWAAHCCGVRSDMANADSLLRLLKTGTASERGSAALALARLRDYRLIRNIPGVFPHIGESKGDLFKSIGMLGKTQNTSETDLATAGTFLRDQLVTGSHDKNTLQVLIWAIGRFESPECLTALEDLMFSPQDNGTLCVGLEALGKIGSSSTSPKLIETIYTIDRKLRCPEVVYPDFSGLEEALNTSSSIVERLVLEIGRIGDPKAIPDMKKLSEDTSFPKSVRNLAADFVFKKSYQRQ